MKRILIIAWWAYAAVGCSALHRLERIGASAGLAHAPRAADSTRTAQPAAPLSSTVVAPEADGEAVRRIDIERVVVRAAWRALPERNGRVEAEFVVSVPKELLGSARQIVLAPKVLRSEGVEALDEVVLRGGLFARLQERHRRFNSVRYPDVEGARLNAVVRRAQRVEYRYTQSVATAGEGKRLSVVLSGRVEALDGGVLPLYAPDTLRFTLSSVVSFADTATRYATRVVERYASAEHRAALAYPSGATELVDSLGDNRARIARIEELIERYLDHPEYTIDRIALSSSASPEGNAARNYALTEGRAEALKRRLVARFGGRIDSLVVLDPRGEDWAELQRLAAADPRFAGASVAVGELVRTEVDPDRREQALRRLLPHQYEAMRTELYPRLRVVRVRLALSRAGTVRDTVRTQEPDTAYARGVRLLEGRRYAEAYEVLAPYADRNAALALLSLGRDAEARELLCTLPESAAVRYLGALAAARLGRTDEAKELFGRACALDASLCYRARLDPELSNLIEPNR